MDFPPRILLLPLLLLLLASGSGCSRVPGSASNGTITLRWTGSSSGSFAAPVTARWCPADTLLELIAQRGDTSVGLALVAQDSVRAGSYPASDVRLPGPARPQAMAGLRWLAPLMLNGYESYGGKVEVTAGGTARAAGTFGLRLRSIAGADTLLMEGQFSLRSFEAAVPPCGRANRRPSG